MEKNIKKTQEKAISKTTPKTKSKALSKTKVDKDAELLKLEERKIKALEKLANSVDALTIWFEEIDKQDWSDRIQFYLAEFHKTLIKNDDNDV